MARSSNRSLSYRGDCCRIFRDTSRRMFVSQVMPGVVGLSAIGWSHAH